MIKQIMLTAFSHTITHENQLNQPITKTTKWYVIIFKHFLFFYKFSHRFLFFGFVNIIDNKRNYRCIFKKCDFIAKNLFFFIQFHVFIFQNFSLDQWNGMWYEWYYVIRISFFYLNVITSISNLCQTKKKK